MSPERLTLFTMKMTCIVFWLEHVTCRYAEASSVVGVKLISVGYTHMLHIPLPSPSLLPSLRGTPMWLTQPASSGLLPVVSQMQHSMWE